MNARVRRGRWLLIAIIAVSLGGDGAVVLLKMASMGLDHSGASVVRWFLTAVLFAMIWHGAEWARWLAVGLYSIGLLFIGRTILFQQAHPALIAVALQFIVALVPLACSSSIADFMKFQRRPARKDSYPPQVPNSSA